MKQAVIKKEAHPLFKGKYIYRAYMTNGTPLYMGEPTRYDLETRLYKNDYKAIDSKYY
jgi:hypothetical protein